MLLEQLAERHGTPVDLLASGGWTRSLLANDPAVADIQLVTSRKSPYWFTPSQREAVQWLAAHKGPVYLCDPDKYARRLVERACRVNASSRRGITGPAFGRTGPTGGTAQAAASRSRRGVASRACMRRLTGLLTRGRGLTHVVSAMPHPADPARQQEDIETLVAAPHQQRQVLAG